MSTFESHHASFHLNEISCERSSSSIVVFVNNEFSRDPRVRRSVEFLGNEGYTIAVICGSTNGSLARHEIMPWGELYRVKTVKPGQSAVWSPLVRFAVDGIPSLQSSPKTRKDDTYFPVTKVFRSLLYALRLLHVLLLNVRLVARSWTIRADLYYANDLDTGPAASWLARRRKKPLLYETHELTGEQLSAYPTWYRSILQRLERTIACRADGVVTVGAHIARILANRYHLAPTPVVVSSCPFYQEIEPSPADGPPFRLLYHGSFEPERGLEELILAMHEVKKAKLYLRGFGHWEANLRQLVAREKLQNTVTFLPPVPVERLVTEAAVYHVGVGAFQDVSLNSRYCRPNKVFEYMMAGLALALSDLPELRQIVGEYDVGILFDPSDPGDIAQKFNLLLADQQRLQIKRQNSLRAAREVFNFEKEGQKLLRMVESVIGKTVQEGDPCAE